MTAIGDQPYSVHDRGGACARRGVRWVAPLRRAAALDGPAPPREPGPNGRPRVQGERWPPWAQVLKEAPIPWPRVRVRWDNGRRRALDVTSGTAVGARMGPPVRPIRWGLVRAPQGRLEPRAYVSTGVHDGPRAVGQQFIQRWTSETTFEESRAHRGRETQRQWSARAIERTTPCGLGLYSAVARLARARPPDGKVPIPQAAWHPKSHATFAEVVAVARRHLWGEWSSSTSTHAPDLVGSPRSELSRV